MSESLDHAIRARRHGRPGPAEDDDAPPPRPFPGRNPPTIPGQLALDRDWLQAVELDDARDERAARLARNDPEEDDR